MRSTRLWAAGLALALAAPVLAQGFGRRGPGGFRGFGGPLSLLSIPEVQKELKLEEVQVELIQQLSQEMRQQSTRRFEGLRNLSPEERQQRFAGLRAQAERQRAEEEKKVAEILDAKQLARLKQLELQREGNRALARREVADQLKLSADQRQKIQAALATEAEVMRSMFEGFRGGAGGEDQRREAFRRMGEVRSQTDAKLAAVLTDAQKKQFQSLQGAPFQFPPPRFGPGGPGRRPGQSARRA